MFAFIFNLVNRDSFLFNVFLPRHLGGLFFFQKKHYWAVHFAVFLRIKLCFFAFLFSFHHMSCWMSMVALLLIFALRIKLCGLARVDIWCWGWPLYFAKNPSGNWRGTRALPAATQPTRLRSLLGCCWPISFNCRCALLPTTNVTPSLPAWLLLAKCFFTDAL